MRPAARAAAAADPGLAALKSGVDQAIALAASGKIDEALAVYADLQAKNPTVYQIPYNMGGLYYQKKDYANAEAMYRKALETKPDYTEALVALSNLLLNTGKGAEAADIIEKARPPSPTTPSSLMQQGVIFFNTGKQAEAAQVFEKIVAADPTSAEPHYYLGTIAVGQNKTAECIAQLEKYLALNPTERRERGHCQGSARRAQEVIAANLAAVRERISRAAARAGRDERDITLVAVSKTHPPERVREAFAAGQRAFGENKVQEGEAKIAALASLRAEGLRWHLVGHLQSNKARKAAGLFDLIHSVDGLDLARKLAQASAEAGPRARRPRPGRPGWRGHQARRERGRPPGHPGGAARARLAPRPGPHDPSPLSRTIPRRRGRTSAACASCATAPSARVCLGGLRALHGHEPRLRGGDRGGGDARPGGHGDLRREELLGVFMRSADLPHE